MSYIFIMLTVHGGRLTLILPQQRGLGDLTPMAQTCGGEKSWVTLLQHLCVTNMSYYSLRLPVMQSRAADTLIRPAVIIVVL